MTTLDMALAILTTISGFGNLAQWVNIKALRDKARYEADNAHIESLKKIIDLQAKEIERLQERQKALEERIEQLENSGRHGNN